jgi:hypothetical protein
VQAALLPLVRHEADIVQVVMKQWVVLMDKVCELQQQYEQIISKAEETLSDLGEWEREAWSISKRDTGAQCNQQLLRLRGALP